MSENGSQDFQTLHEIVRAARLNLGQGPWDFLIGGTETETTLRRNRRALDTMAFRPRVLRDVSQVDVAASLFGRKVRMPVFLAPVGTMESFDAGGAAASARAAGAYGIAQMLSSATQPDLEAVAAAAPDNLRIFQFYVPGEGPGIAEAARRAQRNGYSAFCLTVDTQVYSRRERDLAKRHMKEWRPPPSILEGQARLNWDDVKRFKDSQSLPLVLKGIATAEDAALACEHGVDVVYVSNHGGRQLDHGRGSLEVLPEILDAVQGRARVFFDGGVVRGSDIVKAIALGADAVGIGRMQCFGLAAAGSAGLVRALELLEDEVRRCLGLLGVRGWEMLDKSYLHPAVSVTEPHVTSAFPLLDLDESGY
ncbi:MAG: alpha-hydroxy-acid oxidizing protein [Candidatus Lambdaproteobacteria bacterium]|nr:alpha-hydroxy-acid oxidizing protein [Candidatus Lambdaproteobacteria bacterium]